MIIDCHSHIASPDILPREFFSGWSDTVGRMLPGPLAGNARLKELFAQMLNDPEAEALGREMDRAGISKTVLLVIDFGLAYPRARFDIEEVHQRHRRIMQRDDRFVAFSGVDPRRGREGLALFEKAVGEWGFSGLKVYPPCGFSPSDPALFPYYEICAQRHLPVLVHIGPSASSLSFKWQQPLEIDTAAMNFPGVNFILGHGACTLADEGALLARFRPNLYLDLSGFQSEGKTRLKRSLKRLCRMGLARKIVFGTDWPIHRFFTSQQGSVEMVRSLAEDGLSAGEIEGILSGNFLALLKGEGTDVVGKSVV